MIQHSPEDINHKYSRNITRGSGKNEQLLAFKILQRLIASRNLTIKQVLYSIYDNYY
jgi:hypothetical protein